jgi:thioredoxin 1
MRKNILVMTLTIALFSGCSWFYTSRNACEDDSIVKGDVEIGEINHPVLLKDEAEFENLLKTEKYLIADFFGTWCPPCKAMDSVNKDIAKKYPDIKIVKVNIDSHRNLTGKYGILGVPTFIFFKDGEQMKEGEKDKFVGFMAQEIYEERIKDLFGL